VGTLLADPGWRQRAEAADGPTHRAGTLDYAPVVPRPGKIVCVGLNYRTHIEEMGRELPRYPTLFAKFPEALIGPYDDLVLPAESDAVDWEAELAVVIGERVRHAGEDGARAAIAGYAVLNDVSMRDWQFRTSEWLQGKTFEATTPFGPHLVTTDEVAPDAQIVCELDGEVVQSSRISDLVFDPVQLIRYISTVLTLSPGDVIVTGTTGGVGHARKPPRYLRPGQKLVTRIAGIGELVTSVLGPEAKR
jgi:acylpyruvate hydrolase